MVTSAALLHPVRLRVVQALLTGDGLTTQQLHERLSDVPIATLYRHVGHLVTHGLIEVSDEQPVRGVTEKTYRVVEGLANPSAEELRALSPEELVTTFTMFTSGMTRDFSAYVDQGELDLVEDRVSFAQADFWATTAEVDTFFDIVMVALRELMTHEQGQGRTRRVLTTVLIPRPENAVPSDNA